MKANEDVPRVFFGDVHDIEIPKVEDSIDDSEEDDDADAETDPAVIAMLGFDPIEEA